MGTLAPGKGGWANQGPETLLSLTQTKRMTCRIDTLRQAGAPKGTGDRQHWAAQLILPRVQTQLCPGHSEESGGKPGITLREHLSPGGRFRVGQGFAPGIRSLGWDIPGLDSGPKTYEPIKWASCLILMRCCSSYINAAQLNTAIK